MKNRYKQYTKYKDTGLDWLGEIPSHWEVIRGNYVFKVINERSALGEEELLSVSEHHGVRPRSVSNVNMFMAESYVGYKLCKVDDLVINSLWAWSRGLGFSRYNGIVSTAYSVYRPNTEKHSSVFLDYLLRTELYVDQYSIYSKGIWISRLQLSDWSFLRIPIPLPPLSEQQRIVDFLDQKTSDIDKAIAQKEEMIKLLNERKQILINKAVTRGLNPDVKLKDSGIDWIGEIPEHWEVRKLKYICTMRSGETITALEFDDYAEFPVYGGNGLRGLTNKGYTHNGSYALMGRQGALCGNINYAKGKFWASEHAVVITMSNKLSPIFWIGELLKVMNLNQYSISAAQPGLSVERILNLRTTYPPVSEQQEIAKFIEENTSKIDIAIAQKEEEINLLKEYKSSLIDSAVRGKICLV